jgi:hypothetical protein
VIVVQLTGGLGNQMFQYATGRALAAKHGTQLVLDSSWIAGTGGSVTTEVRRYELACFALDAPLAQVADVARLRRTLVPSRRPVLQELVEPQFGQPCPELAQAGDNTYLRGYWQNVDYFGDAETLLRQDFTFSPAIAEEDAELARQIHESAEPAVSVHVRRSDYVSDPGVRERMGTLEPEYYSRALDALGSGVGSVRQFVFTDDPEWCKTSIRLNDQDVIVGATGAAEMHLMTLCDHHVLADSSFSWWGAWLSPSPAKIVVAPRPWLQDPRWDESGRIPADWVRIDRRVHQADQPPSTMTFAPVT